ARLASARRFPFDPHHTIPELRLPIAAAFALDPARASARLAPWFAPRAVASAHGAKIAHDILRAGQGLMTEHGAVVLAAPHPRYLDADPAWRDLLAPLARHSRLGPLVRRVLAELG